MATRPADHRLDRAVRCASRYTLYCRYISLLEGNRQAARASIVRLEAIGDFEEVDKKDHSLFLRLVHDQLATYREQGDAAAVDELHATVIGKFRRIFGHRHWKTVTATHEYGQLLYGEERYEQAEALYETVVGEVDQDPDRGLESVAVLCLFNALGAVYVRRRKLKEAEAILARAVAGFRQRKGDKDQRTLTAAFNLAGVYQDRGKLSYAICTYHLAAHGFKAVRDISYKTTIAAFTQLAALCSVRRALPEAEDAYGQALEGLDKAGRGGSVEALLLRLDLGILYRDTHNLDAAETLIQGVCRSLREASSGYAPGARTCLATVYARQGRVVDAEKSFEDALCEFSACEEEYAVMSYAAAFGLGELLRSRQRLAEAEAMYRQAWDGACSVGGPRHPSSCTIADALGSLWEQQGKIEDAESLYQQILAPDAARPDRWTSFLPCVNFHKMTGYV